MHLSYLCDYVLVYIIGYLVLCIIWNGNDSQEERGLGIINENTAQRLKRRTNNTSGANNVTRHDGME